MKKKKIYINQTGIKYIKYAQYSCMLLILAFMGLIASIMYSGKIGYSSLIQQNPILLAGFIDCVGNLILFALLKKDIQLINDQSNIDKLQGRWLINIAVFACLLNVPALIAMLLGTMKTFKWDRVSFEKLKESLQIHWKYFLLYALISLCFVLCFYWILVSFSK